MAGQVLAHVLDDGAAVSVVPEHNIGQDQMPRKFGVSALPRLCVRKQPRCSESGEGMKGRRDSLTQMASWAGICTVIWRESVAGVLR